MPIRIDNELPAKTQLFREHIFTIEELRATTQDIRPIKVLIVNLMPLKEVAEVQLLRLLSNSPLQVDVDFCHMSSHESKNVQTSHLDRFYLTFDQIKDLRYDACIITGAPVEKLPFEQVDYWEELSTLMEWTKTSVFSTMHICWGAQAGLYHHYGIDKTSYGKKLFGVYPHTVADDLHELTRGFDDIHAVCQSRFTGIDEPAVRSHADLLVLAESEESGVNLICSSDGRRIFALGHYEYDTMTLANEYFRDLSKGEEIDLPKYYFPNDDVNKRPLNNWKAHANLLYSNWINMVYQLTPYDLQTLEDKASQWERDRLP